MARARRDNDQPRPPERRGPYGPRGGLAGASDDFASYQRGNMETADAWDGWRVGDVIGRGAGHDRIDRGPEPDVEPDEWRAGDYTDEVDVDFGGRDSARYYARHGSNQQRMEARRRQQARLVESQDRAGAAAARARAGSAERREVDVRYHLRASERGPGGYRAEPRHPVEFAAQHRAGGYGPVHEAFGGDYSMPDEDPYAGWPGRDFPGGRGLSAHAWGDAPGDPGWSEPSYGSSPTRQAGNHRGRGPRTPPRSDARIREDICERLTEDPVVDASAVRVHCSDGVVVLEGEVDTRRMKHRAEDVVDACPGVTAIENRLAVRQGGATRAEQRSG